MAPTTLINFALILGCLAILSTAPSCTLRPYVPLGLIRHCLWPITGVSGMDQGLITSICALLAYGQTHSPLIPWAYWLNFGV